MCRCVFLPKHWGRIETINLHSVVVRVWDGSSLILPCTFFTTTPFQNWTHAASQIVGQVDVVADWSVPIHDVRQELDRIVRGSAHWDGEQADLVVQETTDTHLVLRALVGATRVDAVADLQSEVREGLVAFLQEHPGLVPRARQQDVGGQQPVSRPIGDADARVPGAVTTESGDAH